MSEKEQPETSGGRERPITYYDVLGLDRDADAAEIKAAYYKLAREHHPDVAAEGSEMARKFAVIAEAYRVLSDPQRRHQYDRKLPRKSYPLRNPTPEKTWREATDVVLIRSDRFGPLNQAMQAAIPIVLDENMLVITVPGSERHLAGHLDTASNRSAILNALELVAGRRLSFRVIDGTTVEDWGVLKAAEQRHRSAAARAPGSAGAGSAPGAQADGPWEELVQRLHRQYHELPKRQYPQAKARYLREALALIVRTDEDTRYGEDADEDTHERFLARALERLANIVEVSGVVIAYEFERMKRAGDL